MNMIYESGTAASDREDRIRQRAYQIWNEAGQPEGRQEEHWRQAEADIDAETGKREPPPTQPAGSRSDEDPAEGARQTIDHNLQQAEEDAAGQFAAPQHGGNNSGVSSAEPRVLSGEEDGDATFPLRRGDRKSEERED